MNFIRLQPSGFCFGVQRSYDEAIKIVNDNKNNNVYMIGWLVHNKKVIEQLIDAGIKIINDDKSSRLEIAQRLEYNEGDVVILSAHGTDYQVIKVLENKGFKVFDLTCPFVYKTHKLVKNKLSNDYAIIFIGKNNHPETNAILSIDKKIHFISCIEDIKNLKINSDKIFCTNQTTLSIFETENIYQTLKQKYPNIEFVNDICDATTKRQLAIKNIDYFVDVFIIVGDSKSSNANELLKLALAKTNNAHIVSSSDELNPKWFISKKSCVLTAAASASSKVIDEVEIKIKEIAENEC